MVSQVLSAMPRGLSDISDAFSNIKGTQRSRVLSVKSRRLSDNSGVVSNV